MVKEKIIAPRFREVLLETFHGSFALLAIDYLRAKAFAFCLRTFVAHVCGDGSVRTRAETNSFSAARFARRRLQGSSDQTFTAVVTSDCQQRKQRQGPGLDRRGHPGTNCPTGRITGRKCIA